MTALPAPLILVHLVAAALAVPLGLWHLLAAKGTGVHQLCGVLWVVLMTVAIVTSFGIGGGLSWIHALSVLAGVSLVLGLWHLRNGRGARHGSAMRNGLIGLWVAFGFTFLPGRLLHQWMFG